MNAPYKAPRHQLAVRGQAPLVHWPTYPNNAPRPPPISAGIRNRSTKRPPFRRPAAAG